MPPFLFFPLPPRHAADIEYFRRLISPPLTPRRQLLPLIR